MTPTSRTTSDKRLEPVFASLPPGVAAAAPPGFRTTSLAEAEWIRPPPPRGRCPLTGMARTTLLSFCDRFNVRKVTIRKRGALRGIILINRQSLLDTLDRLADEPVE